MLSGLSSPYFGHSEVLSGQRLGRHWHERGVMLWHRLLGLVVYVKHVGDDLNYNHTYNYFILILIVGYKLIGIVASSTRGRFEVFAIA